MSDRVSFFSETRSATTARLDALAFLWSMRKGLWAWICPRLAGLFRRTPVCQISMGLVCVPVWAWAHQRVESTGGVRFSVADSLPRCVWGGNVFKFAFLQAASDLSCEWLGSEGNPTGPFPEPYFAAFRLGLRVDVFPKPWAGSGAMGVRQWAGLLGWETASAWEPWAHTERSTFSALFWFRGGISFAFKNPMRAQALLAPGASSLNYTILGMQDWSHRLDNTWEWAVELLNHASVNSIVLGLEQSHIMGPVFLTQKSPLEIVPSSFSRIHMSFGSRVLPETRWGTPGWRGRVGAQWVNVTVGTLGVSGLLPYFQGAYTWGP